MKVGIVNVGTIGHVDHGRTTLTAALAALGHEVTFLTDEGVGDGFELDKRLRDMDLVLGAEPRPDPLVERGQYRDPARKAERKARMRDAQRRAFQGAKP